MGALAIKQVSGTAALQAKPAVAPAAVAAAQTVAGPKMNSVKPLALVGDGAVVPGRSAIPDVLVAPSKKSAAKEGKWTGINKPVIGTDPDGNKVVFKHNHLGIFRRVCPESDTRLQDIREIVGSHVAAELFGLPTVTYSQGHIVDEQGKRRDGIVAPFVEGLRTLQDTDASEITNGDQAVAQNIIKGWLGDWDIIMNNTNVWLKPDGTALAADFGWSFSEKITNFGVPNANEKVMRLFATRANVEPTVEKIRAMSDEKIRATVDRIGNANVRDWTPQLSERFSSALIHNRDRLRKKNPFAAYYEKNNPLLAKPILSLLFPLIFFSPEFKLKGAWKDPVIVLDSAKALSYMNGHQKLGDFFAKVEAWLVKREGQRPEPTKSAVL